ncbi:unnamed protein product [Pseudo-nitzschia multistriata]|uniref:Uncharacterized protein n=1 Tax=Pseudo-nitzschia multistriata TaxID=183589 RepID=A0A448ZRT9_9STRA|nr:unnamed protein product [Pseudo-nitzschia multistriata]
MSGIGIGRFARRKETAEKATPKAPEDEGPFRRILPPAATPARATAAKDGANPQSSNQTNDEWDADSKGGSSFSGFGYGNDEGGGFLFGESDGLFAGGSEDQDFLLGDGHGFDDEASFGSGYRNTSGASVTESKTAIDKPKIVFGFSRFARKGSSSNENDNDSKKVGANAQPASISIGNGEGRGDPTREHPNDDRTAEKSVPNKQLLHLDATVTAPSEKSRRVSLDNDNNEKHASLSPSGARHDGGNQDTNMHQQEEGQNPTLASSRVTHRMHDSLQTKNTTAKRSHPSPVLDPPIKVPGRVSMDNTCDTGGSGLISRMDRSSSNNGNSNSPSIVSTGQQQQNQQQQRRTNPHPNVTDNRRFRKERAAYGANAGLGLENPRDSHNGDNANQKVPPGILPRTNGSNLVPPAQANRTIDKHAEEEKSSLDPPCPAQATGKVSAAGSDSGTERAGIGQGGTDCGGQRTETEDADGFECRQAGFLADIRETEDIQNLIDADLRTSNERFAEHYALLLRDLAAAMDLLEKLEAIERAAEDVLAS